MAKAAFVFPGQGAQAVGMGRDFYERYDVSRRVFDRADELVDFDRKAVCFDGPDELLASTEISQPALLTTSVAMLRALQERKPALVRSVGATAGLSLGEYTALVFAGALEFDEAVLLVAERGRLMRESGEKNPGAMVSVLGPPRQEVEALVGGLGSDGVCKVANLNCPGQVVISGGVDAVLAATARAEKELGARTIRLKVSGAFHTELMDHARMGLERALTGVNVKSPTIKFLSNVTGDYVEDAEEIRRLLVRQLVSPVLWQASVERMVADGIDCFYEVGPGRVLRGLIRKTARKVEVTSANTAEYLGDDESVA